MTSGGQQLPMVAADCTLDAGGLVRQLDRYRRLGTTAKSIDATEHELLIFFGPKLDRDLLREVIEIEQSCCSFFTLSYADSTARLSISIADAARGEALRALLSALVDSPQSASPR